MSDMRRAAVLVVALLCCQLPAGAWGFEAHKSIVDKAIDLLPAPLKPLFEKRRAFIVERSIDPGPVAHRRVGNRGAAEPFPRHGSRGVRRVSVRGLPRDYAAAVQKFGREFVHQQGLLPWRAQEYYGRLQREFEALKRPSPPPYALDNIVYYSAILAHYVSDGHVPLHAVVNYDGQLTGQQGLHSRWEAELFERYRTRLKLAPAAITPVTNPGISCSTRCWPAIAWRRTSSRPTGRPPPAATSTTTRISRRCVPGRGAPSNSD